MSLDHTTIEGAPAHSVATQKRFDARRFVVALILIPILYGVIRYLPALTFHTLVAVAAILALREFYKLHFAPDDITVELALGAVLTVLLIAAMHLSGWGIRSAVLCLIVLLVLSSRLLSRRELRHALGDSGILVLGMFYISFTLGHLSLIRDLDGGMYLIFFLLLVTWSGDTGAYVAGRSLGRHRLAPVISPNKTVEGLAGGIILGTVVAYVSKLLFLPSLSIQDCVVLGVILTGVGALGDLAESAMKRSAGVKDSSHLIPGHGGLLDRLDSLLFAGPTFYYYVTLVHGTGSLDPLSP